MNQRSSQPPALPSEWQRRRLKYSATLRVDRSSGSADSSDYVGLENIESWTGRFLLDDAREGEKPDVETISGTTSSFCKGDVLFGKLRPYLAKVWLADRDGVCTTELLPLDPHPSFDGRFLKYTLLNPEFITKVESSTFGAKMPRANWDFIGGLNILVPPHDKQVEIANAVDKEVDQIDRLVEAKESMLQLLEQKRAALISRAVTRGFDPNAPTKPSGLDWLGEIPEHWEVERAKNLFTVRDERSEDGGEELLTVSHLTGVTSRAEKEVYMFKADDMTGHKRCMKDDFVTNTLWAWMGAMGVSPLDGIVSPDYHVYTSKGQIRPEFMELLCRSKPFVAEVIRWSKGVWSSRLRLYPENFFEIRFPVPPKSEQKEIVATIDAYKEKTTKLADALVESIQLLKERRSALITAAVTGRVTLS